MTTKHLTRKVNELIAVLYEIKADIAGFEPDLDHPFYPDVYKMLDAQLVKLSAIEELITLRDLENNDHKFFELLGIINTTPPSDGLH